MVQHRMEFVMKNHKKMKASVAIASGVMALGLFVSTPAASQSINLSADKVFQATNVSLSQGVLAPFGGSITGIVEKCKQTLKNTTIVENTECYRSFELYPGSGYSLKVRNFRYVGNWAEGPSSFWMRTEFDIYITTNGAKAGSGNLDEKFNINRR